MSDFLSLGIHQRLGSMHIPVHLCGVAVALSFGFGVAADDRESASNQLNQSLTEFSDQLSKAATTIRSAEWLLAAQMPLNITNDVLTDVTGCNSSNQNTASIDDQLEQILSKLLVYEKDGLNITSKTKPNEIKFIEDNKKPSGKPDSEYSSLIVEIEPSRPSLKNCLIVPIDPMTQKPLNVNQLTPSMNVDQEKEEDDYFKNLTPLEIQSSKSSNIQITLPLSKQQHLTPITSSNKIYSDPSTIHSHNDSRINNEFFQSLEIPLSLRQCLNIFKSLSPTDRSEPLEVYWRIRRALLTIPSICE